MTLDRSIVINRNNAVNTCRHILANKDEYVILETETTGVTTNDVVIRFSIMDLDGRMFLDEIVDIPYKENSTQQGIFKEPTDKLFVSDYSSLAVKLEKIIKSRKVIFYNGKFQLRLIEQTYKAHQIENKLNIGHVDLMRLYSEFLNYHEYPALVGRDYTGEGDCLAILATLKRMAEFELSEIPFDESHRHAEPIEKAKPQPRELNIASVIPMLLIISALLSSFGSRSTSIVGSIFTLVALIMFYFVYVKKASRLSNLSQS